jgi:hypothetical protein
MAAVLGMWESLVQSAWLGARRAPVQIRPSRLKRGLSQPLARPVNEVQSGTTEGQADWRRHLCATWARPQALDGSTPSPSAELVMSPGGETDDHSSVLTRHSGFESWPGHWVKARRACVPTGGCRFGEPCSSCSSPGRSTVGEERPRSVPVARDRAKVEDEVQLLTGILVAGGHGAGS